MHLHGNVSSSVYSRAVRGELSPPEYQTHAPTKVVSDLATATLQWQIQGFSRFPRKPPFQIDLNPGS